MKTPTRREQRMIAILLVVACIALVWLGLISPLIDGFAKRQEERAALLEQHVRAQQLAANLPMLRSVAARQRRDASRFAVLASSPKQAAAKLADLARAAAKRHSLVIKTVQEVEAPKGWVAVRIDGTFGLEATQAFLADLQNGTPVVAVSNLSIAADAAFQSGKPGPMEVRLEIKAPYLAATGR